MSTITETRSSTRSDAQIIALVGFMHGVSHFFHLLFPPLFPWLMREFDAGFAAIGAAMSVFFVVSGVGQALAGFLVDRFGPVKVLASGMACFILSAITLGMADAYWMLFVSAGIAGLGNAVFHPADFTVLNRHVAQPRLGHAFAMHGLSANLGWAAAPVFLTTIASFHGWRAAALAASAVAVLALLVLVWSRRTLANPPADPLAAQADAPAGSLDFLRSTSVWLCFGFFFFVTTAFGAIQSFATPVLQHLFGLSLQVAALALSTYLVAAAIGMVVGGFLARTGAHDRLIATALGVAAVLAIGLATIAVPGWTVLPVMAGIGFFTGIAGPSRDLLVRRAATARFGQAAFGRVYGFVYSGLDAGLALAPLVFGGVMDRGLYAEVLLGIAILQSLAIVTALRVGQATRLEPAVAS